MHIVLPLELEEVLIANDLTHFENERYPLQIGERITVAEAFAAGWRAGQKSTASLDVKVDPEGVFAL